MGKHEKQINSKTSLIIYVILGDNKIRYNARVGTFTTCTKKKGVFQQQQKYIILFSALWLVIFRTRLNLLNSCSVQFSSVHFSSVQTCPVLFSLIQSSSIQFIQSRLVKFSSFLFTSVQFIQSRLDKFSLVQFSSVQFIQFSLIRSS